MRSALAPDGCGIPFSTRSDAPALVARLQQARQRLTSPLAIQETSIALACILDLPLPEAQQAVRDSLALASIQMVAVSPRAADGAIEAFEPLRQGTPPGRAEFRRLLRLCVRPGLPHAAAVQGQRLIL